MDALVNLVMAAVGLGALYLVMASAVLIPLAVVAVIVLASVLSLSERRLLSHLMQRPRRPAAAQGAADGQRRTVVSGG